MNDELISRKEVIDRLQKAQNVFLKHSPLEACGISYAREIIASEVEIPTIEKRPTGKWIRIGSLGNGNAHYECSNCHYGDVQAESQEVPYCWHCGAKMQEGSAK